jgi:hypothetical protein
MKNMRCEIAVPSEVRCVVGTTSVLQICYSELKSRAIRPFVSWIQDGKRPTTATNTMQEIHIKCIRMNFEAGLGKSSFP